MILFLILVLTLLFIIGFTIIAVSLGGSVFIVIFSDVIVCAFIIIWIIRKLIEKRRE